MSARPRPGLSSHADKADAVNPDQSQQLGRALMAAAGLQLLIFVLGMSRRSYLAVAIPVGFGVAVLSGLAFWVGYTMATNDWDDSDFGDGPDAEPHGTGDATQQG